jgi:cobalamin biosynthesis Mg chelatase CobN
VVAEGPDGVSSPRSSTAGGSAGSADAAAAVQQPATNAQGGTPAQQVTGAIGAGTNATVAGAAGQVATDQGQAAAPDGEVLGEQTTTLDTDAGTNSVDVQTEAATRSTGELVVTYGSMFLGTVVLGLLLFLVWSRRRRRTVEGG